jgi:hypothetical protein
VPNKYVYFQNDSVNEQIDSQLKRISMEILKNIPGVISIIIAGGFGKGEGSVKITSEGRVECLRDFDIVVIVDHKPSSAAISRLEDHMYKSIGMENPRVSGVFERAQSFVVDLRFWNRNELIYPDIYFYDLKSASQILWGEDVRKSIPWTNKDVPLSSGFRVLYEQVMGLLGYFSINFVKGKTPTEIEKNFLISQCRKTFVELGTALNILSRKYEPTFSRQAEVLENSYEIEFPELAKILPDLPEKVSMYTGFRLRPNPQDLKEDPIELFFLTQRYLKETLRFYLERWTGKSLSNFSSVPELMSTVALNYYSHLLGPLLKSRLGLSNNTVINVAQFLFQGLTNVEYSYVVASKKEGSPISPLLKWWMSPSLKHFTSGSMLLFSLNPDSTIDRDLLENAERELRNCVYSKLTSFDSTGWEELRMRFLIARKLYIGYHFVK